MKKYEFTGETKEVQVLFRKVILHRIKAVVAFGIVEVGEIGGWIEKEENLSHEEKAWVYGDAKVWGNAKVYGNAEVCGDAEVFSLDSLLTIIPVGVNGHCATFFRTKDKTINVKCSWFLGDLEEFKSRYVNESGCDEKQTKIIEKDCKLAEKWIDLESDCESDESEAVEP